MHQDASQNGSARCCLSIRCDGGSSAFAVLVGAVSYSAAGPCRPRAAWHWLSRCPECARLLQACAAREIQKEADASWREHLLFLPPRFFAAGNVVYRVAVASLPRRRNAQSLRPIDVREMGWSKTRVTSCVFFGEGLHDFFRCDWDFVDSHTDSVVDGVGNRRHDRQQGTLTDLFCPKRPARIWLFNQFGNHFGHVERSRALVFQDGREFVHESVRKLLR